MRSFGWILLLIIVQLGVLIKLKTRVLFYNVYNGSTLENTKIQSSFSDSVIAKTHIIQSIEDDKLLLQGTFHLESGNVKKLSYKMTVNKRGRSGNAQTSQSGTFVPHLNRTDTLNSFKINMHKGEHLSVSLKIYDENNRIIGRDSIHKMVK